MVAVTTARTTHRPARPARRLHVVARFAEVGGDDRHAAGPAADASFAFGARPERARCGCHARPPATSAPGRPFALAGPPVSVGRLPRSTYRRRRLVAGLVVAGLLLTAWAALGAPGGVLTTSGRSTPPPRAGASVEVVEVGPGDTLWSIARRLQPSGEVRPLVDRLAAVRGGTVVHVGEQIAVPRS